MDNTTELIKVKNQVLALENEMQKILIQLPKKKAIQTGRCDDYGVRGFPLTIYFDDLNIEVFSDENVKRLKELFETFHKLRIKQRSLEETYNSQKHITSQIAEDVRKVGQ